MTFATSSTRIANTLRRALAASLVAAVYNAHADTAPFHWGYSAMFGSGTYLLSGAREVDVHRASFRAPLRSAPEEPGDRAGISLLLPVALGLYDVGTTADDVDRDDELKLATFLPGVAVELMPGKRLRVRPSVQIGAGRELNADGRRDSVRLAAFGVRTRVEFASLPGRPALINGLLWAGFEAKERFPADDDGAGDVPGADGESAAVIDGERGSLLRFTTGFEFHVPTPRWRFHEQPMYLQPHVLAERYYRPPGGLSLGDADEPPQLEREWQIGVAAGRETGFKILFLRFDSVGIAYRYSGHHDGLRFFLNSVF